MEFKGVRRTPRYPLVADVEMTDVQSAAQLTARTKMLSIFGCGVDSSTLFPKGTVVRIKLSHQHAAVWAFAKVVYSSSELGMGLAFTSLERTDERLLERWIAEYLSTPVLE